MLNTANDKDYVTVFPTSEDEYWHAVMSHDRQSDGKFVYAVRSTRVYCRPSCPSRRPARSQVLFFLSMERAEREGFRECMRCRPKMFEQRKRLEAELQIASEIQSRLKPQNLEALEGWEIICSSEPCHEIGGDYHDVIRTKTERRMAISLGDVSGKGIGAALLMSSIHAAVRAQSRSRNSVGQLMSELNDYIYENTPSNKYASLFYSELDVDSGFMSYSNAGHHPPILAKSGAISFLPGSGFPLGMIVDGRYSEYSVNLSHGDVILIYSDGVTELTNPEEGEFGISRLMEVLKRTANHSAGSIDQELRRTLGEFADGLPPKDDISWIVLKRSGSAGFSKH